MLFTANKSSIGLLRSLLRRTSFRVTCQQIPSQRYLSGPSIKRYNPITSPLSVWWSQRVPISAKYGSGLILLALSITHIHPNTLITLGPPTLAAAYFLYRRREHAKYLASLQIVKYNNHVQKSSNNLVAINRYNPADAENVLTGIENEFDNFRHQIIPIIRTKMVEYVMETNKFGKVSIIVENILDENDQVGVFVGEDPETFVTSKAESDIKGIFPKFVSFSVPYFSSRNVKSRRRLGTLQVSMLEVVKEGNTDDDDVSTVYKLAIQAWPYRYFSSPERIL